MSHNAQRVLLVLLSLLMAGGCESTPTTILLHIRANSDLPAPDELRLSAFTDEEGRVLDQRRIPASGTPILPGDVVLYPRLDEGEVRILVRAAQQSKFVGEGAVEVRLKAGEQVSATVVLAKGALPDKDGDGVPDLVDNCPGLANPKQGPCSSGDGGTDADPCDRDKDGHKAKSCGGSDCDDDNAAVNPGKTEGPAGDATCSDALDNDCDGAQDLADTGCIACNSDSECDDNSTCTADSCTGGKCVNAATNEGSACDDDNKCTTSTTCAAGKCAGGSSVTCPPANAPCKGASCDATKGCTISDLPDGTSCKDSKYCTVNETCAAGVCTGQPRDCNASAPKCKSGKCDEAAGKCVYSAIPDGTTCDDGDSCTQGERCKAGLCTAPGTVVTTVDKINVSRRSNRSLAADSKGMLHTSYATFAASAGFKYASDASGSWKSQVLDGSTKIGAWSSVVVGPLGGIYVVYADEALGKIMLASRPPTSALFTKTALFDGDGHCSAAMDPLGKLHVSYQEAKQLYYASGKPGKTMKVVLVDQPPAGSTAAVGYHSALALDTGGRIHIAHGVGTTTTNSYGVPVETITSLRYSTDAAVLWKTIAPVSGLNGNHGGFPAIAVTGSGSLATVHIAHTSGTDYLSGDGVLYVTTKKLLNSWSTQTLASASPANAGTFSSIQLDSKGNLLLAYRNQKQSELRFATNASGSWVSKVVDTGVTSSNGWASMVQLPSGQVHITYEAGGNSELRHAVLSACP